jgi:hypothetical protein
VPLLHRLRLNPDEMLQSQAGSIPTLLVVDDVRGLEISDVPTPSGQHPHPQLGIWNLQDPSIQMFQPQAGRVPTLKALYLVWL